MPGTAGINPTLANGSYQGDSLLFKDGLWFKEIAGRDGSLNASEGSAEKIFLAGDSEDPAALRTALLTFSSIYNYDGAGLESISWERQSNTQWNFTLSYNGKAPAEAGDFTVSIDTSGGMVLQTSAYAQTKYDATGKTGSDYGNAIDVQDGVAQGVQRIIPALKLSMRAKISSSYIDSPLTYARLLANLTGTTNNAAIYDDTPGGSGNIFQIGELLFAGAQGDVIGTNPTLTFNFIASQNVTGLTIGEITGIAKKGHEYLWFAFYNDIDGTTKLPVQKPRAAYVGQVYGAADHSLMKIGVA